MIPADGNPFLNVQRGAWVKLEASHRYVQAGHLWSQPEIDALILAWAAHRPLLVRGEAGSGKSQIARAAADRIAETNQRGSKEPLVEVIHPRFEALDLLYQVDSVARLADAQLKRLDRTNRKYVRRGRLWEAIEQAREEGVVPVLLIDEIDKADAEVPNALLEVLGNRSFTVPPLNNLVVRAEFGRLPLIIITTNEERELPPAFVRRCIVLNLSPPEHQNGFVDWLVERGTVHDHLKVAGDARRRAAEQVFADRQETKKWGYPPVGLAEYIDLLTALDELTRDLPGEDKTSEQLKWLERLSAYALQKNAGQPQRSPQAVATNSLQAAAPES